MTSNQREDVKSGILAVDRGNISPENIHHAKKLLKMTGKRLYRVLYLKAGIEHKSAWFISINRARQALDIVRGKGHRAIIYVD